MKYYIELSDRRNIELYDLLRKNGKSVQALEFLEKEEDAQGEERICYIVSPARILRLSELSTLRGGSIICCGSLSEECRQEIHSRQIEHINLLADSEFVQKNAALTAEGVLALLLEQTPFSIFESKILILGDGRCATAIARLFGALGLDFGMAARSLTANTIDIGRLEEVVEGFDVIINTVPAKILSDDLVKRMSKGIVFFEIASKNCLDKDLPLFRYIPAPQLPTRYCPKSAARLMLEAICKNTTIRQGEEQT